MFDVAIIGAGIIGGMISRELSKYNLKIILLEKNNDVAMGATMANSAIVHAGFDAKEGSLKAKFNVMGSIMMEKICNELGVDYINNGALVVGYDKEDLKTINSLYERGINNGVKDLKILNKSEIKEIEPNISDTVNYALYAPTSSIISPYNLALAAIGNAMDNGCELKLNFSVDKIEFKNDYYSLYSKDEEINAKYVINCAGIYADSIAKMIGDNSFDLHARKGEYILLDNECGVLANTTIFKTPTKMGKGILVSPTVHGNLLLGPTSTDIIDKEDKSTSTEGINDIIAQTSTSIKNIPLNKTITSFCGLRAVGNTGDFIITNPTKNFINVAGIESPGLSSSPAIAVYVVDMLKDINLELNKKTNFNPYRKSYDFFKKLSTDEKNEVIKNNPSYGKIICKCEKVTKGEIINAIHMNPMPSDIDGIKRRTRSSMGRCQGGFCYPDLVEILSEELNIPYEKITKFGGSSYINFGKTKNL